jgi:hypothetical protein
VILLEAVAAAQAGLMAVDEWAFHRDRGLGRWESWGHAADSLVFAAALAPAALLAPSPRALALFAAGAAVSTLAVTKDEWVHARECGGGEQWLHAVLFVLHPCVFAAVGLLWARGEAPLLRAGLPLAALAWAAYQWAYWVGGRRFRR